MCIKFFEYIYRVLHYRSLLLLMTKLLEKREQFVEAVDLISKELENGPTKKGFYELEFKKNYLITLSGDYDKAIKGYLSLLRYATEKDIDIEVLLGNIIELYNKMNKPSKAISLFEEYMASINNVSNSNVFFNLGNSYFDIQDFEKAIYLYQEFAEKGNKRNPDLFFNLGLAYFRIGRYEECKKEFMKALKYFNNKESKGEVYYSLGILYLELEDKSKAKDLFHKAKESGYTKGLDVLKLIK